MDPSLEFVSLGNMKWAQGICMDDEAFAEAW